MATTTEPNVEYLTPAELAARYHVSKRLIHHWVANGTIKPAFRTGKVIRFDAADVDAQLKKSEGAAGERGAE